LVIRGIAHMKLDLVQRSVSSTACCPLPFTFPVVLTPILTTASVLKSVATAAMALVQRIDALVPLPTFSQSHLQTIR
jgi:hypothetical protein